VTDEKLWGQVQKKKNGDWVDVLGLCFQDVNWACIVAGRYNGKYGEYRVEIRDHPDGVPAW
jgi:hypothetical protein